MDFSLAQVSRQPPPSLPGGYTVGEQVYYTGAGKTVEDGYQLEHGKQGEVVGPAIAESLKGKGVTVLFPGNKDVIQCLLNSVRAAAAANGPPAAPHHPTAAPPPRPPTICGAWAHR